MASAMQTVVAVSLLDGVDTSKLSSDDWYFLYQIDKGWNKKILRITNDKPELQVVYRERLKEEVNVILKMKFPSYFLIVQDMLLWCDTAGIRRGPGRGSAAGSLVAYVLDIVKVDPIKYGLLFSRFLNKDRISMPDIDNDIESDKRDEVKKYLVKRYGQEYAASIGTFGTMQVKGAIKDIIRSLNIGGNRAEAFMLADKLNIYVPDGDDVTFDSVCRQQPEFRSLVWYPSKEELAEGWTQRIANGEVPSKHWEVGYHLRKMEGMIRQSGTHAAGVVVSPISLSGIIPMAIDKWNVVTTAIDGTTIDALGFLKIDVLSLKTLSIIEATLRNIKKTRGTDLKAIASQGVGIVENETDTQLEERIKDELEHIQQASRAFKLLREGRTLGIFQCEAPVAQNLLKAIQANDIEDIAVVNALNRPGPLKAGLVGEFGDRKFGRIKWELPHPSTAKTLAPTFGVLCYQEQAMQLAVDCAGFSMSGADSLRKACGKKLPQEMEKLKKQFIDGCYKNHTGFDSMVEYETFEEDKDGNPIRVKKRGTIAERLWNDIAFFASYAFNKSHAVCYAFVAYYTAFLKANYPAEFWAAQLSYESDQVKINRMIIEAKASGLKALPVSINTSEQQYVAESPTSIRRSLGTLKQVGKSAIEELVQHRPYNNIYDFIIRCNSRKVNSKRMVALIAAGAFDEFGITRKTLTNKYPACKKALDRFLVRRIDYYIKDAGARKNCLSKPTELDLELLANMDPTLNKEHNLKFIRIKQLAQTAQAHYLAIKDTVVQDDYESLAAAHTGAIKEILELWEQKASEILVEDEWTFDFIENEDDKTEWGLEELITNEKAVYGTAVSAHIFDKHPDIEAKVMEKFPTNFYTLDSDYTQLGNQFELVMMIEVVGLDRQFPYKKDPTKFTRLYRVEDRFGAGEVTVFDKSYDEFLPDDRGIQVRVWKPGNIIVVKVKTNFFNGRKSLVFDKCFKLVYTRQS